MNVLLLEKAAGRSFSAVDQFDLVGLVQDFVDGHVLEEGLEFEGTAAQAGIAVEPDHEPPGELGADVGHLHLVAHAAFLPVTEPLDDLEYAGEEPDVFAVIVADEAEDEWPVEVITSRAGFVPADPALAVTEINVEGFFASVVTGKVELALEQLLPGHLEHVFQFDFFP